MIKENVKNLLIRELILSLILLYFAILYAGTIKEFTLSHFIIIVLFPVLLYGIIYNYAPGGIESITTSKSNSECDNDTDTDGCITYIFIISLLIAIMGQGGYEYLYSNRIKFDTLWLLQFCHIPFFICSMLYLLYLYLDISIRLKLDDNFPRIACLGCIVVLMGVPIMGTNLMSSQERTLYYRTKRQLLEVPMKFPAYVLNANENTFLDAISKYESEKKTHCFYFDLQWSILYSLSTEEKNNYLKLNELFQESKARWPKTEVLAYELHEALMKNLSHECIENLFNQLNIDNIYNTGIYFRRISITRNYITATKEQEWNMAGGSANSPGKRMYGFSPCTLTQAIVNSTCFTDDEKENMLRHVAECYLQLAISKGTTMSVVQKFKNKVFDNEESDYHITGFRRSEYLGSAKVDDMINELCNAMYPN